MSPHDLILLAMQASILLTVFGLGLEATVDDVLFVVRRPALFLRSFIAMFFVMPLVALLLDKGFDLKREIDIALMALALSPVPPLLPKKENKAGARQSYGLGLMATMAILSIVFVPLGLSVLELVFGRSFSMPLAAVSKVVFVAAVLPLMLGIVVRVLLPRRADWMAKWCRLIGTVLLICVALLVVAASMRSIIALIGDGTLPALLAFIGVGLLAGHWLGGPVQADRPVLALSTASRHPGIALALATANFPDEHGVTAAILLYLLLNFVVSVPYVKWQRGRVSTATSRRSA